MPWGNRRLVGLAVIAPLLVVCLAGCSAPPPNVAAVSIGQEAHGFTSSSTKTSTGWTSAEPCSTSLQNGIESGASAGVTLTPVDPKTVSGPISDPALNTGDVSTCAFRAVSATRQQIQEFFVGMPQAYFSVYAQRLTADGFVSGAVTVPSSGVGSEQIFSKGDNRVVLLYDSRTPGLVAVFG